MRVDADCYNVSTLGLTRSGKGKECAGIARFSQEKFQGFAKVLKELISCVPLGPAAFEFNAFGPEARFFFVYFEVVLHLFISKRFRRTFLCQITAFVLPIVYFKIYKYNFIFV